MKLEFLNINGDVIHESGFDDSVEFSALTELLDVFTFPCRRDVYAVSATKTSGEDILIFRKDG